MMTRGRGGVWIPPKSDDVIYEQPLKDVQNKEQASSSSSLLSSDTPNMEKLVEESMITAVVGRMGHLAEPTLPNIIYIIYLTTQIQMHHCPVMQYTTIQILSQH